jgi:hypothetical protein
MIDDATPVSPGRRVRDMFRHIGHIARALGDA